MYLHLILSDTFTGFYIFLHFCDCVRARQMRMVQCGKIMRAEVTSGEHTMAYVLPSWEPRSPTHYSHHNELPFCQNTGLNSTCYYALRISRVNRRVQFAFFESLCYHAAMRNFPPFFRSSLNYFERTLIFVFLQPSAKFNNVREIFE